MKVNKFQQLLDKYQIKIRTVQRLNPVTLDEDIHIVFENASSEQGFERRLIEFKIELETAFIRGEINGYMV